MVDRKHEKQPVRLAQTPQVSRGNVGQVSPGQAGGAFSTQVASPPQIVAGEHQDRMGSVLVQHIIGKASGLLGDMITARQQQAYLDGALAVNAGIAEEDLETNFLTRDWSIAGHRDYSARLAVAEYESNLVRDLAKDREMSPEAYTARIQHSRQEIMPIVQGMSAQGRDKMLDQLLTLEMSAQKNHYKAHQEWIAETKVGVFTAEINASVDKLVSSRHDPELHSTELNSLMTKLYHNVVMAEDLSAGDKADVISQVVEYALENGEFDLFRAINTLDVVPTEHGAITIAQTMPFDKRTKMSKAFHAAEKKYFAAEHANFQDIYNDFRAKLNMTGEVDQTQASLIVERAIGLSRAGVMSADKANSIVGEVATAIGKNLASSRGMDAWLRGNHTEFYATGMSDKDAAKQFRSQRVKAGDNAVQLFQNMFTAYSSNNSPALAAMMSEMMDTGVAAWKSSPDDVATKGSSEGLNEDAQNFVNMVGSFYGANYSDAETTYLKSTVLQGMDSDNLDFVSAVFTKIEHGGMTAEQAVRSTKSDAIAWDKSSTQAKNAIIARNRDRLDGVLDELRDTRSFLSNPFVASIGGAIGNAKYQTKLRNIPFVDQSAIIEDWGNQLTLRADEIGNRLINSGLIRNDKQLEQIVLSELSKSIVNTDYGNILLPEGVGVQDFTGDTGIAEPRDMLERAANAVLGEELARAPGMSKNTHIMLTADSNGVLIERAAKRGGGYAGAISIPIEKFRAKVADLLADEREQYKAQMIDGVDIADRQGNTIKVSGNNNHGYTPSEYIDILQSIVDYEAVRYTTYNDPAKGVNIGPGLNSTNPEVATLFENYTGKKMKAGVQVAREYVESMFATVADSVIRHAQPFMRRLPQGANRMDYSKLLIHFAWQWGTGNMGNSSKLSEFQDHLSSGPSGVEPALSILRELPPYKQGHKARKQFYETLVRNIWR